MKKSLLVIISCFLVLSISGCGNNKDKDNLEQPEEKINLNDNIYYYTDVVLTNKDCGDLDFQLT